MKQIINITMVAFLTFGLGACSSSTKVNNNLSYYDEVNDPLEKVNRAVFSFNGAVTRVAVDPLTHGYRMVVPKIARQGISNFLKNLRSPVSAFNQILQGDFLSAGETALSFVVNSTLGVGGFGEVANSQFGLKNEEEDFGQTLAVWGVPEGPYIVWPLLGPSNVRDSIGFAADLASDPSQWYVNRTDRDGLNYAVAGVTVLDTNARLMEPLDELKRDSLDYYAAIRSVYRQFRNAQIADTASSDNLGGEIEANTKPLASSYDELEFADYQ